MLTKTGISEYVTLQNYETWIERGKL